MVILSLFDGMSCGQLALQRCGIPVEKYYASEIDKFAIKVTKHNFPNTIHIGDVRQIDSSSFNDTIDMVIGGSPCQSFSFAGRRNGMTTVDNIEITSLEQYLELKKANFEFQGESYLFWEFVRIVNELKPKYFFLENVMMEERWSSLITQTLGVHPLEINSRLVSAQNRRRLYWTNIGLKPQGLFGDMHQSIEQPKDLGILLKDILQDNPNAKHYLSEKWSEYIMNSKRNRIISDTNQKSDTLTSRQDSGTDLLGIIDEKYYLSEKTLSYYINNDQKMKQQNIGFSFSPTDGNDKSKTITTKERGRMENNYIICHSTQGRSENRPSIEKNKNAGGSGHLSKADGKSYCLDVHNSMAIEIVKPRDVIQLNESKESNGKQPYFQNRIYDIDGISPALTSFKSDLNIMVNRNNEEPIIIDCFNSFEKLSIRNDGKTNTLTQHNSRESMTNGCKIINKNRIRRLTPIECERLQTVPDNYTSCVSDAQRYKMLGNGWTIDVIAHIFKHIEE